MFLYYKHFKNEGKKNQSQKVKDGAALPLGLRLFFSRLASNNNYIFIYKHGVE